MQTLARLCRLLLTLLPGHGKIYEGSWAPELITASFSVAAVFGEQPEGLPKGEESADPHTGTLKSPTSPYSREVPRTAVLQGQCTFARSVSGPENSKKSATKPSLGPEAELDTVA